LRYVSHTTSGNTVFMTVRHHVLWIWDVERTWWNGNPTLHQYYSGTWFCTANGKAARRTESWLFGNPHAELSALYGIAVAQEWQTQELLNEVTRG